MSQVYWILWEIKKKKISEILAKFGSDAITLNFLKKGLLHVGFRKIRFLKCMMWSIQILPFWKY